MLTFWKMIILAKLKVGDRFYPDWHPRTGDAFKNDYVRITQNSTRRDKNIDEWKKILPVPNKGRSAIFFAMKTLSTSCYAR